MIFATVRRAITALIVITGVCVLAACSPVETEYSDNAPLWPKAALDFSSFLGA